MAAGNSRAELRLVRKFLLNATFVTEVCFHFHIFAAILATFALCCVREQLCIQSWLLICTGGFGSVWCCTLNLFHRQSSTVFWSCVSMVVSRPCGLGHHTILHYQRLWSYDLTALYKSVYYYYPFDTVLVWVLGIHRLKSRHRMIAILWVWHGVMCGVKGQRFVVLFKHIRSVGVFKKSVWSL